MEDCDRLRVTSKSSKLINWRELSKGLFVQILLFPQVLVRVP